jgi:peptidoglycan/xylan/chitin deacetylase (PgdA/CDA1 family)
MLNFRNTNIFFTLLLTATVTVHIKYGMPVYIYCLLLIAYSLILFWGCINVSSNFFIPIICKADTYKKEIAISFDDGPAENYTKQILEVLKSTDVKATFFFIGNRIAGNEAILKQVKEEGHIIGNRLT